MRDQAPEGMSRLRLDGDPLTGGRAWRLGPRLEADRPLIVLLPGIEGDARVFLNQVALTRRANVLALDLPGAAESLNEAAHAMRATLATLAPQARPLLVGLSLGGLIARAWAEQDPTGVLGLVTLGTLPSRELLPGRVSAGNLILGALPEPVFARIYRARIRGRLRAEGVDEHNIALLTSALPTRQVIRRRLDGIARWGLADRLATPSLWLRGDADTEAPWGPAELTRALPGAAFASIPGGHRAPLTHPAGFNAAVERFLQGRG